MNKEVSSNILDDAREKIACILLRLFNEGFIMGELGVGDDQLSTAAALDQILAIKVEGDRECDNCKGKGWGFNAWNDKRDCIKCNHTGKLPGRTLKQALESL